MITRKIDVLIVDDEKFAREGFRNIIDWDRLGFRICAEASDAEDALDKIWMYQPGLVLLDVRLPDMLGTEGLRKARETGYQGEVIILSGYTDFEYAREAMSCGAFSYLVKPVDERELQSVILQVRDKINNKGIEQVRIDQFYHKTREKVLIDLLTDDIYDPMVGYYDLGLVYPQYQVVIYEIYEQGQQRLNFAEILGGKPDAEDIDQLHIDHRNVILLEGAEKISRFHSWIQHLEAGVERNSYIDSIFFVYGEAVTELRDIRRSYTECLDLIQRRLFCEENQHMLSWRDLPERRFSRQPALDEKVTGQYSSQIFELLQQRKRRELSQLLSELRDRLAGESYSNLQVKHFVIDVMLQVRHDLLQKYGNEMKQLFDSNTAMIESIESSEYFYEIIRYMSSQFEKVMERIGNATPGNVVDDVVYYIRQNYASRLTLESIAPLFGYTSSYLGKMLSTSLGCNFNSYLDQVRLEKAEKLLTGTEMMIQDIAIATGYRYIDVFNQKFRRKNGCTPSEYRRSHGRTGLQSD